MEASQFHKTVWIIALGFMSFPHFNLGLLSDYKICGNSECESLMSRAQAIRDHHSTDCRFLSFRRGDNIFVYHKLTGKRTDLWAGTIDKQFGYFPKDAVKEEQVYATKEIILESQKSDFFCTDEYGYPIHLDSDDDDNNDGQEIQIPTETTQIISSANEGPLRETSISAQETDGLLSEGDQEKNQVDDVAMTNEGVSASSSSPWLGSSVTGWLGLGKEEESSTLAEEEKKDENLNIIQETQTGTSLTSSVTGWLGFGGESKTEIGKDSETKEDQDRETPASLTSTMTGGLGFGMETKEEEEHQEEKKTVELFRSRRLSLDLEGNQLQAEEKKETGSLDWLRAQLSSTLGLGLTSQDSRHEAKTHSEAEEMMQEEQQPVSSSWFNMGIDMLGFRKDERGVDEITGGREKDADKDEMLQEPVDASQTENKQMEEMTAVELETSINSSSNTAVNESKVEINQHNETQSSDIMTELSTTTPAIKDSASASENRDTFMAVAPDVSFQTKLDGQSETESKATSKLDSLSRAFIKEGDYSDSRHEETNLPDEEKSPKMKGKGYQMTEKMEKDTILTLSDTSSENFVGVNSKSVELFMENRDQLPNERVESYQTRAEIENGSGNTEHFTGLSAGFDDHEVRNEIHTAERDSIDGDTSHTSPASITGTEENAKEEEGGLQPGRNHDIMPENVSEEAGGTHDPDMIISDQAYDFSRMQQKVTVIEANTNFELQEETSVDLQSKHEEREAVNIFDLEAGNEDRQIISPQIKQEKSEEIDLIKQEVEMKQDELKEENEVVEEEEELLREEIKLDAVEELKEKGMREEDDEVEEIGKLKKDNKQEEIKELEVDEGKWINEDEEKVEELKDKEVKENEDEAREVQDNMGGTSNLISLHTDKEMKQEGIQEEKNGQDGRNIEYEESLKCSNGFCTHINEEGTHSDQKTVTEEESDMEEKRRNQNQDANVNDDATEEMPSNDADINGSGANGKREADNETFIPTQADPQVLQDATQPENTGAFGLFQNAFSFFTKTPPAESKSTEPTLNSGANTEQISQAQSSEQETDSATGSTQVYIQDLDTDSHVVLSSPPSSISSPLASASLTEPHFPAPTKAKSVSKHYQSLLTYMSVEEVAVLTELFGQHKLQFLGYILGSSYTETDYTVNDESILLEVETLLLHHRQVLFAPSTRLSDAPQEDKEKTRRVIALHKLESLLERVRETFNTWKPDGSKADGICDGPTCLVYSKEEEMTQITKQRDLSVGLDNSTHRVEGMEAEHMGGDREKDREANSDSREETTKETGEEHVPGSQLEGLTKQILVFHQIIEDSCTHVHAISQHIIWFTVQVVSSLPDDIRPGPDLYGVPWESVIISALVGLITLLVFSCRCYSSVKSRMYRNKERWMADQIAQLLDEKCKVLETLSKCQQEHDDLENSLRDSGVLAQTQKTIQLEAKAKQLEHAKKELKNDLDQLKDQLEQHSEQRTEQERRILMLEESMKTCEEEIKDLQSQEEQAQTTLKVYSMNSDRLQRNLETAGEENTLLQESNAQLRQQVEGWAERVSELDEEMRRCEISHSGMLQDVATKDERIMSLTDRLLRMKAWDSDLQGDKCEQEEDMEASNGTADRGETNGKGDVTDAQSHLQKVQKLIYAAKLNADLKSVDEDKDRVFAKLNDEVKAKEDLQVGIKEMEKEKISLQSDTEHYSDQVQRLQQKLHIMTEMYQENELKLHRMLTVEEKERLQKEEKLNKADKNIALAMEELNNYKQRAEEMEEELEKTKQSYQTQISAHEKKAHNNWLAARAAERELADVRRDNALFRQKLTDTQFKLDTLDKDPYALDSLARPLPFRAERSPYGPSPLGRPASETRAFLSPPTLMDGPPARLSPRAIRGPVEPPAGQGEMDRSGGPHSDSGSISPTWERDRRGPPPPGPLGPTGPPGYMFPEPGGPMYRRPPPGPMVHLPPPGSLPLGPRGGPPVRPPGPNADMADGPYRENSFGPGEQEHRELANTGNDLRAPPEADPRMGVMPPPGPLAGPMDGPFPRRALYGAPPPDFYPSRGPGGPPVPMWGPPPPGMMFPTRFPGGPLPPPHMPLYGAPTRPPPPDGLLPPSMGPAPPQQPLPSPPQSQSPEQHTLSPQDII